MTATLIPEREIQSLFHLQDSHSPVDFINMIDKISINLERIHLSVFSLEQKVEHSELKEIEPLEEAMFSLEPFIISLLDLNEIMFNKGINKGQQIMKIQSEWSSLQHFLTSVKKQLMKSNDEKELISIVENILIKMDDISFMIFDFQEKKYIQQQQQQQLPTSSSSEVYSESTVTTNTTATLDIMDESPNKLQVVKEDQLILNIDNLYDPLLQQIDSIYQRIHQLQLSPNSILNKRCIKVKEKWESLQFERDELKFEHKEDRWLAVFRRVADQVDVMIDGLDRSVVQCYSVIQQVKDWQSTTSSGNVFDKLKRSFSSKAPLPIDKEKFKSIEKSFEAKYKYYTPSIDRMLSMLGNGISARASRDNQTSQRHDSMIQRWYHLKEVMDELRSKDLIETDRIINYNLHSTTSSSSSNNSSWRGIRYKTPEPQHDRPTSRSSRSNYQQQQQQQQQSLLRGSLSDSSSIGSSSTTTTSTSPHKSRQTKTPRPTRNGSITTSKKEDFYDEDERYYGVDLMKLNNTNTTRPPSSNTNYNIRSASTLERKRSQDKPFLLNSNRSKTPNPPSVTPKRSIRSKSSMGDLMMNRVMSPRSVTPSLIPRPKTPKEQDLRSTSPLIPRPKSQSRHYTNNNNLHKPPPPVPPIPKYVISHENDYAAYRDPTLLRKKQSMPTLTNNNRNMEISFHEDCIYHPDPKDPLDLEVGHIVNASPISIKCSRAQPGRYYFGNELSMSSMGGKKMYTCKLMTYNDRRGGQFKNNKVLIRVGGGWQDLEFFLLEHSSLMASDVVVRSFAGATSSSRNHY